MKTRLIVISLIGLWFLALIWLRPTSAAGPIYQGQSLMFWMGHLSPTSSRYNEASEAVRALDVKAVPLLTRTLRIKDSPLERSLRANWVILPAFLQARIPKPTHPNNLRAKAGEGLRLLGPKAKTALPVLIDALNDPDSMMRVAGIAALEAMGPEAHAAVPALTRVLNDEVSHIRGTAARAIWEILQAPGSPKRSEEFMLGLLKNEEPLIRLGAAECLLEKDPASWPAVRPVLEPMMRFGNRKLRPLAAYAITRNGTTGELALAASLSLLHHRVLGVREDAFNRLEELGPAAAPAIPQLIELLRSPDASTRSRAASVFAYLGTEKEEVIEALIRLLSDANIGVQFSALRSLDLSESRDPRIIEPSIRIAGQGNPRLAFNAIRILGQCGLAASNALPTLKQFFIGPTNSFRSVAAYALGKMGAAAEGALPELAGALQDADPNVRIAAAVALATISPSHRPEAQAILAKEIRSQQNAILRTNAGNALAKMGGLTPDLVPALKELLNDPVDYARLMAASALLQADPKDAGAWACLIQPLRTNVHRFASSPQMAATTLGNLGALAQPAITELTSALTSTNRNVRMASRKALNKIAAATSAEATVRGESQKETPKR